MLVYWTTLALFLSLLTLVWNDKWMANPFNIGSERWKAGILMDKSCFPIYSPPSLSSIYAFSFFAVPPSLTQNHVELLQSFLLHLILNDGLELLAEIFFSRCETKENYLSEFITTFLASNIQERDWTFERKARNTVKCKKGENLTKRMERKLSNWISCAWKCVKSSWLLAAG